MQIQFPEPVIPDHVPASLVRPFPYVFGMTTRDDPFGDWARRRLETGTDVPVP